MKIREIETTETTIVRYEIKTSACVGYFCGSEGIKLKIQLNIRFVQREAEATRFHTKNHSASLSETDFCYVLIVFIFLDFLILLVRRGDFYR